MTHLRRTAAVLAAASLSDVLPGIELLGGGDTQTGFFYQFFYPHSLVPETPHMIEEQMRQIVREKRPLREMEMVACSARELFLKSGHPAAAEALEDLEPKDLVSVIKIGKFIDLAEGPFCAEVEEVKAFQILAIEPLGDQEYRLEGAAATNKDELKAFLKKRARYVKENHLAKGLKLGLWRILGPRILWLEKGLETRAELLFWLREKLMRGAREVAAADLSLVAQETFLQKKPLWWVLHRVADPEGEAGLMEEVCQSYLEQLVFPENLNSLLQTIEETLMILGFHAFLCSEEQKDVKEWSVEDGLGRSHGVIALTSSGDLWRMSIGVERILALLLERTAGDLPPWLKKENRTLT
ncbi:MAG: hypothetical protein KGJ02_01015 [Verrucomicrobiota bacterium]|nr:hypothetical protein [Verrucomicrobiota bacterium]